LRSIRAKNHGDQAHSHARCCDETPCIFLTVPPAYAAVAIHLGPCERRLRCERLATSSLLSVTDPTRDREAQRCAGPIDAPQGWRRLLTPQGYPSHWPVALEKAWLMFHSPMPACAKASRQPTGRPPVQPCRATARLPLAPT